MTPADSIYLSASAWFAVNRAEVRTAFVNHFDLKGFDEAVPVYRVVESQRTQVYRNQFALMADLRGFTHVTETAPLTTVEEIIQIAGDASLSIEKKGAATGLETVVTT